MHERTEELRLHRTMSGRFILMRNNPLLSAAARENLDADGLIRRSVVVNEQTVLASVLRTIEVDIGGSPPAPGMARVEDVSIITPFGWSGAVVADARYESQSAVGVEPPENQLGRIVIELRLVLPVCVGDILLLRGRPFVIAGVSDSTEAEVIVDASIGRLLELSDERTAEVEVSVGSVPARWAMAARSTGPYSLITLQPLARGAGFAGQQVTPAHVHALAASGMSANLAELVTLKSDDVPGRERLDAALRGEGGFPAPGTPETFRVLLAELTALGLKPSVHASAGYSELSLVAMTDLDRRACSSGAITKAETVHFRTLELVAHGLMCEQTFGPEDSPERRTRFGHIELPDPIVPWIFRMPMPDGGPSILSGILKVADDQIAGLLDHELWLDEHGEVAAACAPRPGQLTGALAVDRLLKAIPDEALPTWLRDLPDARSALVARTILLLPPDLRPLILLQSGNFATSNLNDHYRRVINRANRLRKLKELNAPEVIVSNEMRMLQRTTDSLFANTFLTGPRQSPGPNGRPLRDLLNLAMTRLGSDAAKPTDYSAIARAVALSSVDRDSVVLPESMATTLKLRPCMPVLVTRPPNPGEFAAPFMPLRTGVHEHAVIGLHAASHDALFAGSVGVGECIIHRPVTPAALEEAHARIGYVQTAPKPPRNSWSDQQDLRLLLATLLNATVNVARVSFDSPAGILLAGTGSARYSTADPPNSASRRTTRRTKQWWAEVPKSWEDA